MRLAVRVKPRGHLVRLGEVDAGRLKLEVTAPPADGAANAQARALIADEFGVGISQVRLVRGARSRDKLFDIFAPRRLPAALVTGNTDRPTA